MEEDFEIVGSNFGSHLHLRGRGRAHIYRNESWFEEVRTGLAAGGEWIRTIGTRKISYRFETDFCRPGDGSDSQTDSFLSRRGTDGSNPAPSSGESIANRIFSVQ